MSDPRYPYTYACDFIRGLAGYGPGGTKLSRGDASQIRQGIAAVIDMDDEELANKLADAELAKSDEDHMKSTQRALIEMGMVDPRDIPRGDGSSDYMETYG